MSALEEVAREFVTIDRDLSGATGARAGELAILSLALRHDLTLLCGAPCDCDDGTCSGLITRAAGREVAGETPAFTMASRPAVELPETLDETLAVLDELWIADAGFVQCGWRLVTARGHVVLRSDVDRPSAWNGGGHPIFVRRFEGPPDSGETS